MTLEWDPPLLLSTLTTGYTVLTVAYSFDIWRNKINHKKSNDTTKNLNNNNETTSGHIHTHKILTNKIFTHTHTHMLTNYTGLRTWFRRLLCHVDRKWIRPILQLLGPTQVDY